MSTAIKRKLFPLPRIGIMIQQLEIFISATALKLSQGGYYSILICLNTAKRFAPPPYYRGANMRIHAPPRMGVACAPDIFQSKIMDMLGDFDYVLVYIDAILIIQQEGKSKTDHLHKVWRRCSPGSTEQQRLPHVQTYGSLSSCKNKLNTWDSSSPATESAHSQRKSRRWID